MKSLQYRLGYLSGTSPTGPSLLPGPQIKQVRYYDYDKDREIVAEVEETNGSLAYVRDVETGQAEWRGRFELKENS